MSLTDVAYHVVHDYPGSVASLAPRLDKSPTQLSHEVSKTGAAKLGLETAAHITDMTGDDRILIAWAARRGYMLLPAPDAVELGGDRVMEALSRFLSESADVVQEVSASLADGTVNRNELDRLRHELGESMAAQQALLLEVERRYLAGVPAGQEVRP